MTGNGTGDMLRTYVPDREREEEEHAASKWRIEWGERGIVDQEEMDIPNNPASLRTRAPD